MNDKLREALEELARKWVFSGEAQFTSAASELREILVMYPDETTTEWGLVVNEPGIYASQVYRADDQTEAEALTDISPDTRHIVSRQVTPWKAAS